MSKNIAATSHSYRMYFIDDRGKFIAGEDFCARGVEDAIKVAKAAAYACRGSCVRFEVWDREQMIFESPGLEETCVQALERASQESVLDLEEQLCQSFTIIAKSRVVLGATEALRTRLSASAEER